MNIKKGPFYTRDGSSIWDELGQRTIVCLIIRLRINTGKQTDHPSKRTIWIIRVQRRITGDNSSERIIRLSRFHAVRPVFTLEGWSSWRMICLDEWPVFSINRVKDFIGTLQLRFGDSLQQGLPGKQLPETLLRLSWTNVLLLFSAVFTGLLNTRTSTMHDFVSLQSFVDRLMILFCSMFLLSGNSKWNKVFDWSWLTDWLIDWWSLIVAHFTLETTSFQSLLVASS